MSPGRSILILVALATGLSASCRGTFASPGPSEATQTLDESILQLFTDEVDEGNREAWAIIAKKEYVNPTRVWEYRSGQLKEVDEQFYYDAIGANRSKWPPHTFTFTIVEQNGSSALVEYSDLYDMGLNPDSRGGNSGLISFEYTNGTWQVVEWTTLVDWD